MNRVWIIEMYNLNHSRWESTVGCKLDRDEGRAELKMWRRHNPTDRFRLVKYIPEQP